MANGVPLSQSEYASAGGNLGAAIGMQGVLPQHKDLFLADQKRKAAEDAKAAENRETAMAKWASDLDIKGVHRLDLDEAKGIFTETFNDLVANYSKYTQTQKRQKLLDAKTKIYGLQARNKDLEAVETQLRSAITTKSLGSVEAEKAYAAMTGKTWKELMKTNDPLNGVVKIDPNSKTILVNPIPNVDVNTKLKSFINDPKYMSEITGTKTTIETSPDGTQTKVIDKIYGVPEEKIGEAAKALLVNNQDMLDVYQYRHTKELPAEYWNSINSQNPAERANAIDILSPYVEDGLRTAAGEKMIRSRNRDKAQTTINWDISPGGNAAVSDHFKYSAGVEVNRIDLMKRIADNPYFQSEMERLKVSDEETSKLVKDAADKIGGTEKEIITFVRNDAAKNRPVDMRGKDDKIHANSIPLGLERNKGGEWDLSIMYQTGTATGGEPTTWKTELVPYSGKNKQTIDTEYSDLNKETGEWTLPAFIAAYERTHKGGKVAKSEEASTNRNAAAPTDVAQPETKPKKDWSKHKIKAQ